MSKSNGHDKSAEVHIEPGSTVRSRKARERRKSGTVVLRNTEVGLEMLDALVLHGWLFEAEKSNPAAVSDAVGALLYASLSAGIKPIQTGKALVPVSLQAVNQAAAWLRPDEREQLTPESAGRALSILADCAELSGFNPQVFTARAVQLTDEIRQRGVIKFQDVTPLN